MNIVKSGIPGLDKLLGGGFVKGKTYLLESVTGAKPRFLLSAFFKQGYQDGDLCKIDLFDYSYAEIIEDLKSAGFDPTKVAVEGKFLIVDFMNDVIYGSEVSGPHLSASSHGVWMGQFEHLRTIAREQIAKLKPSANGLRVAASTLSSLIRIFGLEDALKFNSEQISFVKQQGGVLLSILNPDTVSPLDLAIIEETFDGIIELTIKEEKMKFQRYIRVKNSPIPSFGQERLPYEIVGAEAAISIGSKITEDFESFKANIKMTAPGVIDVLGDRGYIDSAQVFGKVHKLVFEALGYEEGFDLMSKVGIETAEAWIRQYLEKFKLDLSHSPASFTALAKEFVRYTALSGYGVLELIEFDPQRRIVRFKLCDSPVAQQLAGYGKPVDAYVVGSIIACTRVVLGRNTVCKETMCVAKGDDHCEFEVVQA